MAEKIKVLLNRGTAEVEVFQKADQVSDEMLKNFSKAIEEKYKKEKALLALVLKNTKGMTIEKGKAKLTGHSHYYKIEGPFDEMFNHIVEIEKDFTIFNTYSSFDFWEIISEFEKIENKCNQNKNWDELQKSIFIFDELCKKLKYAKSYIESEISEISTLQGIRQGKRVNEIGASVILSEMLTRLGIENSVVLGNFGENFEGSAWNVVKIGDRAFYMDLYGALKFVSANKNLYKQDPDCLSHLSFISDKYFENVRHDGIYSQQITIYSGDKHFKNLSQQEIIDTYYKMYPLKRPSDFFEYKREDGSKFLLIQRDKRKQPVHQYLLVPFNKDKNEYESTPFAFYSETDFYKAIDNDQQLALFMVNNLFGEENIKSSDKKRSSYLGQIVKDENNNFCIDKPKQKMKEYPDLQSVVCVTKNKGVLELVDVVKKTASKKKLNKYNYRECDEIMGKYYFIDKTVYSEDNLIKDKKNVVETLLGGYRMDECIKNRKGYVGSVDKQGNIVIDNYADFFL